MVKFDKSTLSFFSKQIWWSLTFYTNQFTFVASHFLDEIQNFYILSWILGLSSDGPKRVGQKKEKKKSGPLQCHVTTWKTSLTWTWIFHGFFTWIHFEFTPKFFSRLVVILFFFSFTSSFFLLSETKQVLAKWFSISSKKTERTFFELFFLVAKKKHLEVHRKLALKILIFNLKETTNIFSIFCCFSIKKLEWRVNLILNSRS